MHSSTKYKADDLEKEPSDVGQQVEVGSVSEEDMRERVQAVFSIYAEQGIVNGEDFMDIIAELGIQADRETVAATLQSWDAIDFDAAADAVEALRSTNDDKTGGLQGIDHRDVIKLTLFKYIAAHFPWRDRKPNTDYVLVAPSCDIHIPPRQMLLIATGFIMLFMGLSIILTISMLWLDSSNSREKVMINNFQTILTAFTEEYDNKFMSVSGNDMSSEIGTFAQWLGLEVADRQQESKDRMSLIARLVAFAVRHEIQVAETGAMDLLKRKLRFWRIGAQTVVDGAPSVSSSVVINMAKDLNANANNTFDTVVYDTTQGTVVVPSKYPCPDGGCNVAAMECVAGASAAHVNHTLGTRDAQGMEASAVFTRLPGSPLVVCCLTRRDTIIRLAEADATTRINALMQAKAFSPTYELALLSTAEGSTVDKPLLKWHTVPNPPLSACYFEGTCNGIDTFADGVVRNRNDAASDEFVGPHGTKVLASAAFVAWNTAIVLTESVEEELEVIRQEYVDLVDYLNFNFVRSTELVVGRRLPSNEIEVQSTKYRFSDGCYAACSRRPASGVNAIAAFENKGTGWSLTPDYRPEPVLGAYAFIDNGIEMSFLIERDVIEMRGLAFGQLVEIFEENNKKYDGSMEVLFTQWQGMPDTAVFDPEDSCQLVPDCYSLPEYGVVFRSDCVHCVRLPQLSNPKQLKFRTTLKNIGDCRRKWGHNCSQQLLGGIRGIFALPLDNKVGGDDEGEDYRGEAVFASTKYIQNYSAGLIAKVDKKDVLDPVVEMIAISIGSSTGVVLVALCLLLLLSRKVLDRIEQEWQHYKDQIEEEKKTFGDTVREVVPWFIAEDLMKGNTTYATTQNLCHLFADMCGMSIRGKTWDAQQLCRYMTYVMYVMDGTAHYFKLYKVCTMGDRFFAVAGLRDETSKSNASQGETSVACLSFATVILQMFSDEYAHFPGQIPLVTKVFGPQANHKMPDVIGQAELVGAAIMPGLRIGLHDGPSTVCLIASSDKRPKFDVLGPNVGIAARMQATALVNCIHVTTATKDNLERILPHGKVEFTAKRKTVMRGRGSVSSHLLSKASIPMPQGLLRQYHIQHSRTRIYYNEDAKRDEKMSSMASSAMDSVATY